VAGAQLWRSRAEPAADAALLGALEGAGADGREAARRVARHVGSRICPPRALPRAMCRRCASAGAARPWRFCSRRTSSRKLTPGRTRPQVRHGTWGRCRPLRCATRWRAWSALSTARDARGAAHTARAHTHCSVADTSPLRTGARTHAPLVSKAGKPHLRPHLRIRPRPRIHPHFRIRSFIVSLTFEFEASSLAPTCVASEPRIRRPVPPHSAGASAWP